jgi:hypothetical protein
MTCWALGAIVGPSLGGSLTDPCSTFDSLASSPLCRTPSSLLRRLPFLLPFVALALSEVITAAISFWSLRPGEAVQAAWDTAMGDGTGGTPVERQVELVALLATGAADSTDLQEQDDVLNPVHWQKQSAELGSAPLMPTPGVSEHRACEDAHQSPPHGEQVPLLLDPVGGAGVCAATVHGVQQFPTLASSSRGTGSKCSIHVHLHDSPVDGNPNTVGKPGHMDGLEAALQIEGAPLSTGLTDTALQLAQDGSAMEPVRWWEHRCAPSSPPDTVLLVLIGAQVLPACSLNKFGTMAGGRSSMSPSVSGSISQAH